ncbi:hypothetical protein CCACVL1_29712 [Corchorus capsularis]|uniref:Uncharacterized protein n=1 Tax=Corchorus capsularis TaxID=210143 RepID=A0A1R3G0E3_COCAP|nr:hypothetical protein CCACVL1_29712 [Corchorus capsularis]
MANLPAMVTPRLACPFCQIFNQTQSCRCDLLAFEKPLPPPRGSRH